MEEERIVACVLERERLISIEVEGLVGKRGGGDSGERETREGEAPS